MPLGVKPDQVAFYVDQMKKVVATQEWKDYLQRNALKEKFLTGDAFQKFLEQDAKLHHELLDKAGFIEKR